MKDFLLFFPSNRMLRQTLSLVALLLVVSQCSAKPKPPFCRDYDCPGYTVKLKTDDYELRCYNSYKWVSTDEKGILEIILVYRKRGFQIFSTAC